MMLKIKIIYLTTDQIIPSESLFTYTSGVSTAGYSHPTYVPVFLEDALVNAPSYIIAACNNDPSCIYDYVQTGSEAIGLGTLATIAQNTLTNMIACKHYHCHSNCDLHFHCLAVSFPPNITGPAVYSIKPGMVAVYNFTVTAAQQFQITVIGNLTGNLTNYGGLYSFSTYYTDSNRATVTFLANDTLGSVSLLIPQLQICACLNGGTCTKDGIRDVNQNPLVLNCRCSKGMHQTVATLFGLQSPSFPTISLDWSFLWTELRWML